MSIGRKPKLWTGISAAALLAAASPQAHAADSAPEISKGGASADTTLLAFAGPTGEGGEGEGGEGGEGEGGEAGSGGEFGVDPAKAAEDPVPFTIVLDVIRAHYLAGLASFETGDAQTAGEMFAHPVSEVYVAMESVFEARGVAPFDESMLTASRLVYEGAPAEEVRAAADTVLKAVDAAEGKAPQNGKSAASANAAVLSDLIERAALQYQMVEAGREGPAYVDGYGFCAAAQIRADRALPGIEKADAGAAKAIRAALERLKQAYPGVTRPDTLAVQAGELLALSSGVRLATGG